MKPSTAKSLLFLLLLAPFTMLAQQPNLKVAGKDSANVWLTKLKTEVKVIGNYAVTTMEMEFCNTTNRVLEGELTFPMPDGVSISRYGIDINGKIREAVPVEKEKGQVVFENIIRRRVDPGLLERVDGNNFRTRIYPIPANGCRTVLIGYEQLLSLNSNHAFVYSLPLHFKESIKQFDFSITVASNYIPEVGSDCNTNLKFEELNKAFISSVSKQDFMPDGDFTINVPKTADATEISMQSVNGRYYFLLNTFPQVKKIEKKIPDVISVIWDASLSGMNRDHKKEMELLDAYIQKKGNLTINLFQTDLDLKKINTYSISNGNWSDMKKALEDIVYDGASNFNTLANLPPSDEYLFFTDGLHNWGNIDNIVLPKTPVYTICADVTANYSLLKYIAATTGGAFINLNGSDIVTTQKYLTEQTLQFLGIKPTAGITEVYPSVATPLVNGCSIAGISNTSSTSIILQYGYGSTVAFEQQLNMNASLDNNRFINIEKIWAQKKIAELDVQYEKNKEQINELGRKYAIVTRNSSLIVLELISDYVKYEIEPPAELMEAYTSLKAKKRSFANEREKDILAEARGYFEDVKYWWGKSFKSGALPEDPYYYPRTWVYKAPVAPATPAATISSTPNSSVKDTVGVNVTTRALPAGDAVAATATTPATPRAALQDTDGDSVNDEEDKCINEAGPESNFGCPVISESIIKRVNIAAKNIYFRNNSAKLDSKLNSGRTHYWYNYGYTYSQSQLKKKRAAYFWNKSNAKAKINITSLIPERVYLKELDSVSKESRYKKYLELRKNNNTPIFYSDVANMFFRDADTATGYKILSNIAELSLDDFETCKMLGYMLKCIKKYDDEVMIFRKVMQLRPQEPQSYRDYALALADAGKYQQALDTLYLSLTKQYDRQIKGLYPGIEEITLTEMNELIAMHGSQLNIAKIPAELIKKMPVDVRVVLNWNMNDNDINLVIIDPNGERCYHYRETDIGGKMSRNFSRGYGPEQFMLKNTIKGKYKVMANYYSSNRQRISGLTTIMAEIYIHYGTPSVQKKVVALQIESDWSKEVLVGEFSF